MSNNTSSSSSEEPQQQQPAENTAATTVAPAAPAATTSKNKNNNKRGNEKSCHYCGEKGHLVRACEKRKADQQAGISNPVNPKPASSTTAQDDESGLPIQQNNNKRKNPHKQNKKNTKKQRTSKSGDSNATGEAGADEGGEEGEEEEEEEIDLEALNKTNNGPQIFRYVLLVSYIGTNYKGSQVNPEFPTIEGELLKALRQIPNMIALTKRQKSEIPRGWQRVSRTDTGVHALRNMICSIFGIEAAENPNTLAELNKLLPDDIRVNAIKRVNQPFKIRDHCRNREYKYVLPLSAVAAGNNVMFPPKVKVTWGQDEKSLVEKINQVLARYKGRHSFHNFNDEVKAGYDAAYRIMYEVGIREGEVLHSKSGKAYAIITIHGNSFMKQMIRKMMGLLMAIMRGMVPESIFDEAYDDKTIVPIPIAPGLGLYLYRANFDTYNQKRELHGKEGPLIFSTQVESDIDQFRNKLHEYMMEYDETNKEYADYTFQVYRDQNKYFKPRPYTEKKKKQKGAAAAAATTTATAASSSTAGAVVDAPSTEAATTTTSSTAEAAQPAATSTTN